MFMLSKIIQVMVQTLKPV